MIFLKLIESGEFIFTDDNDPTKNKVCELDLNNNDNSFLNIQLSVADVKDFKGDEKARKAKLLELFNELKLDLMNNYQFKEEYIKFDEGKQTVTILRAGLEQFVTKRDDSTSQRIKVILLILHLKSKDPEEVQSILKELVQAGLMHLHQAEVGGGSFSLAKHTYYLILSPRFGGLQKDHKLGNMILNIYREALGKLLQKSDPSSSNSDNGNSTNILPYRSKDDINFLNFRHKLRGFEFNQKDFEKVGLRRFSYKYLDGDTLESECRGLDLTPANVIENVSAASSSGSGKKNEPYDLFKDLPPAQTPPRTTTSSVSRQAADLTPPAASPAKDGSKKSLFGSLLDSVPGADAVKSLFNSSNGSGATEYPSSPSAPQTDTTPTTLPRRSPPKSPPPVLRTAAAPVDRVITSAEPLAEHASITPPSSVSPAPSQPEKTSGHAVEEGKRNDSPTEGSRQVNVDASTAAPDNGRAAKTPPNRRPPSPPVKGRKDSDKGSSPAKDEDKQVLNDTAKPSLPAGIIPPVASAEEQQLEEIKEVDRVKRRNLFGSITHKESPLANLTPEQIANLSSLDNKKTVVGLGEGEEPKIKRIEPAASSSQTVQQPPAPSASAKPDFISAVQLRPPARGENKEQPASPVAVPTTSGKSVSIKTTDSMKKSLLLAKEAADKKKKAEAERKEEETKKQQIAERQPSTGPSTPSASGKNLFKDLLKEEAAKSIAGQPVTAASPTVAPQSTSPAVSDDKKGQTVSAPPAASTSGGAASPQRDTVSLKAAHKVPPASGELPNDTPLQAGPRAFTPPNAPPAGRTTTPRATTPPATRVPEAEAKYMLDLNAGTAAAQEPTAKATTLPATETPIVPAQLKTDVSGGTGQGLTATAGASDTEAKVKGGATAAQEPTATATTPTATETPAVQAQSKTDVSGGTVTGQGLTATAAGVPDAEAKVKGGAAAAQEPSAIATIPPGTETPAVQAKPDALPAQGATSTGTTHSPAAPQPQSKGSSNPAASGTQTLDPLNPTDKGAESSEDEHETQKSAAPVGAAQGATPHANGVDRADDKPLLQASRSRGNGSDEEKKDGRLTANSESAALSSPPPPMQSGGSGYRSTVPTPVISASASPAASSRGSFFGSLFNWGPSPASATSPSSVTVSSPEKFRKVDEALEALTQAALNSSAQTSTRSSDQIAALNQVRNYNSAELYLKMYVFDPANQQKKVDTDNKTLIESRHQAVLDVLDKIAQNNRLTYQIRYEEVCNLHRHITSLPQVASLNVHQYSFFASVTGSTYTNHFQSLINKIRFKAANLLINWSSEVQPNEQINLLEIHRDRDDIFRSKDKGDFSEVPAAIETIDGKIADLEQSLQAASSHVARVTKI